jgi:hypothetical protein
MAFSDETEDDPLAELDELGEMDLSNEGPQAGGSIRDKSAPQPRITRRDEEDNPRVIRRKPAKDG